jgi:hypothetical protein
MALRMQQLLVAAIVVAGALGTFIAARGGL